MPTSIARGCWPQFAPTRDFPGIRRGEARLRFDPFLDAIPDRLIPHVIACVRRHRRQ
jgi:hypothetical protein